MKATNNNQDGKRRSAGRPRKSQQLRESMTISVDPAIKEMAAKMRNKGACLNEIVMDFVKLCIKEGLVPIPGADFQVTRDEENYIISWPCIKIK